ncbi:AI-2E family transporter [Aetokthonos hydrillicola]|uniref:AI-2E family transporter n=1 Tax=Aetokthonos hydrillicola TaxID=1550245 RepID=UPI001ABB7BEC
MSDNRNKNSLKDRLTQGAPLTFWLVVIAYILYRLVLVLEIVAVAGLLALVMQMSLEWLQRIVKVRSIAVLIMLGLVVGFGAFIGLVLIPNFIVETQVLLQQLPNYVDYLRNFVASLHNKWSFVSNFTLGLDQLRNYLGRIITSFPLVLSNTFNQTVQAIGTVILAIYMATNPSSVLEGILRLIPRRYHDQFLRLLPAIRVRLQGWIFGVGIAMVFVGVGAGVGLYFIGIPLFISFGFFAGILEIIPYFGSIIGTLLPALIALTIPHGQTKVLLVLALFLVLNQVDAHIIQPLIVGKQVDLNPIIVIIAFLVMGELFGLVGVLLAVPAAAIFVTLIDEFNPERSPEKPLSKPDH